jgi:hypothetical protein
MPVDRLSLSEVLKKAVLDNQGRGTAVVSAAALTAGLKFMADVLDEFEKRLDEEPFRYDGPHESGKAYHKGTFVTHGGGLWHCNYTTASRPGDGPAWTLAVKHGRDLR